MGSSGKGLAIIALIIGASGLGFGVFSFINYQTGIINPSGPILVGLWESLYQDTDNPSFPTANDWLIEVGDEKIENSAYLSLNQSTDYSNTRFHLKISGWYKVNIHVMLTGVSSALPFYSIHIVKNGTFYLGLLYEVSDSQNLQVNRQFYIDCDGNDYFEMNCYHGSDSFTIEGQQVYNQLCIEFIGAK